MALTTGTRLGPYEILGPLGAGGMGEVYRARDAKLNREVALKVLPDSLAGDPDRLARFRREAQVLAALNHPNIAHIHGFEDSGTTQALVMELVEGPTLADRIAQGPIPLEEALPIARQIADALEAAHEQGIVHRDLKPANIKVRPDGTVKVLDFGLAKALDPATTSGADVKNSPTLTAHATQMGIILGTAAYMAPEQARGKPVDRRADIWAFGVVLYEMLTGRRAFDGDDVSITLASVLKEDVSWEALPRNVPASVRRLLRRCLEKDSRRRLSAIGDARLELDEANSGTGDDVLAASAGPASRAPRWRRALPWAVAVLGLALFAAALAYPRQPVEAGTNVRFTVSAPPGAHRRVGAGFALSPDGEVLAFEATGGDGVGRIFRRRLDQLDAQPVPGTERATVPFWSPDSRSLGFSKDGALYRTDLSDSAPRRLCEIPGRQTAVAGSTTAPTWGSAGIIVATSDAGLFQVSETGGGTTPVTSLDVGRKEAIHASPSFLPDGRRVLFLALAAGQTRGDVWVVAVDDGTRTRLAESSGGALYGAGWLLTATAAPRGLVAQRFDPDRIALAGAVQPVTDRLDFASTTGKPGFSLSTNGTLVIDRPSAVVQQLIWTDRLGRVERSVGPTARIPDFALSPDGKRVAVRITDNDSLRAQLWLFDSQRMDGTRLTFQGDTRRPMWSADGRHLYFSAMPGWELRSLASGASEPQAFDNPGKFMFFEDATRDGRYLILKSADRHAPIWIQRVGVPAERRVVVDGGFLPSQPRVSPDGRWVAYTVPLSSGAEVFVQPFDRLGARQQVSRTGGAGAVWRADGRELFYETRDALMTVPITERAGELELGTPTKLFSLRTQGAVPNQPHNIEVAAGGQRFLINSIVGDSDNAPLEVTLNWTRGMTK